MKLGKIYISLLAVALIATSCDKEFIEIEPKGQFLSENYYADGPQAFSALIGVYDVLRKNSGGFDNMVTMMNAGSDDQYAGGGNSSDGAGIQGFSNYTINPTTMPASYWNDHYQGIFRANTLISKLPQTSMEASLKERFMGEAKVLRAYYFFNLVRMFGNVPLVLEPLTTGNMYDVEQASPEAVYTQIEKDLSEGMASLPPRITATNEYGRLSKGAAQAILGKVYLYQKKGALAAVQLAEVNGTPGGTSQYGFRLLTNYNDLWVVSNKFNAEYILECSHSSQGNSDWGWWGASNDEGNTINIMVGPRSYSRPAGSSAPDLPSGWSFNVFTQDFYSAIASDPRFTATVFDLKTLNANGQANYIEGYQNTGYFLNKFLPRQVDVRTGGGALELNYRQNTPIIRLADTYLMEAEALGGTGARAQALLDAVRSRVGLPSIPVTLNAIKAERRLELAGEGHRFFDLVRWGDAAAKLGDRGFVTGKNEIFPIPVRELEGTLLKQNPGYN